MWCIYIAVYIYNLILFQIACYPRPATVVLL